MHRSRLSTLLIDVPGDHASDAAAFWSAALGVPASPVCLSIGHPRAGAGLAEPTP
jgi:hypothetical protein